MITEAIVIVRFVQHPIHPISALPLKPVPAQNLTLLLSRACRLISLCNLGFMVKLRLLENRQTDSEYSAAGLQCKNSLCILHLVKSDEQRRMWRQFRSFFCFSCHLSVDCLLWRYSLINTNTDPCSMLRNVSLKIPNLFATSCSFFLCESKCF